MAWGMAESMEDRELSQDLLELGKEMESVRSLIEPEYMDVQKYVTPWLSPFRDTNGLPPEREPIFDDTAVKACRRMGNGLMGFVMSPTTRWFLLGLFTKRGPVTVSDIPGAAAWLRRVEDCLYGVFAASSFYPQGADMSILAGSHGSPTMRCEPPKYSGQPWAFITMHPKSMWFSENERKDLDVWRRKLRLQNKSLIRMFSAALGEDHAKVKDWKNKPTAWTHILHYEYPNDEFDPQSYGKTKKKIRAVYMTEDGCILDNGGLDGNRYMTWRWQATSDQVYSTSAAMDAMDEVKVLQQMRKTLMQTAQQHAEPPVNAPDSMRGKVKMAPRSINYYDKPDQIVSRMNVQGNYPVAFDEYKYQVNSVDDFFYGNLWLLLERQPASARLTAYQVSQMIGEKAAVLGPVVANHQSEFADPLISLVFNTEMKAGRIPLPPPGLVALMGQDGKGLKIVPHYIGPLAMAQRRNGIMDGFMTALQAITPIAQIRQEVLDHVDFDKWVRIATVSSGAPEEVINGMDTVVQIRQGRMEAAAAERQQAMQMELAKGWKGLAVAPEQGSPGQSLGRALGLEQPEQAAV